MNEKPLTERSSKIREFIRSFLYRWTLRRFRKSDKTVDLGCGWGVSLSVNNKFWLIDADAECISHLKSKGARAFLGNFSEGLPFSDAFFENAFTHDVLEHLDEGEMADLFKETRRILVKNAVFMNIVPNKKGYQFGVIEEVGHKRFVTESEIKQAAEQTGFRFVKSYRTPFKTFGSELLTHNKLVVICRAV